MVNGQQLRKQTMPRVLAVYHPATYIGNPVSSSALNSLTHQSSPTLDTAVVLTSRSSVPLVVPPLFRTARLHGTPLYPPPPLLYPPPTGWQELTHPLPVVRARELVKFSESPQYLGLVRRGLPL